MIQQRITDILKKNICLSY